MLDLKDLNVTAAAERATCVELEHPATGDTLRDDDGKPYFVELLGEDSAVVRKIDRKHADTRNERIRKGKDWNTDSASLENEVSARLAAATVSWYLPPLGGETLDCTHRNKLSVYTDDALSWIPEQLTKAIKDRKRFFSPPSTI